jgi:type IV pilus assembly protein PilV
MRTQKQRGFTLVEVLIALLVLSFGLLGIANLQLSGVSTSRASFERSQAALLANEIVERIRANLPAATAGNYNLSSGATAATPTSNCIGVSANCSPADLAAADLAYWQARVNSVLSGTDAVIQVNVSAGIARSVNLTLSWGSNDVTIVAELT